MKPEIAGYRWRFLPCDGFPEAVWKVQKNLPDTWSCPDAEFEALVSETVVQRLEEALEAIIERSHNGELGSSKVIDMRKIAEKALKELE